MTAPTVYICQTGIANTASVAAAFKRLGTQPLLCGDGATLRAAKLVVLPGVGAFGAGMKQLNEVGLAAVIRDRITAGCPTLAICLGLQLLAECSEEAPGVGGIGAVTGSVERINKTDDPKVRVPQLGWNSVEPDAGCQLLRAGYAYFANSYALYSAPVDYQAAYTDHGGRFVAALERGAVLACQFHPELSGRWGQELLGRWLELAMRS